MNPRIALLLAGVASILALATSGCAASSNCDGEFCVTVYDAVNQFDRCTPDAGENCNLAAVYFTAEEKGEPVPVSELTASMTLHGRAVGAEGSSELFNTDYRLNVQLLLDRSLSVSQSGDEDAVKSAATGFISSLPDAAKVRVLAFASEATVPVILGGQNCSSTDGDYYDKATASKIIADCYHAYTTPTSSSETRLYDAIVSLPNGIAGTPDVAVVFTDGADTASSSYTTPESVHDGLTARPRHLTVYAVGLGSEPNASALRTATDNRYVPASDGAALDSAFQSIASQLRSFDVFRVIVPTVQQFGTDGRLKVSHQSRSVEQPFTLDAPF